MLKFISLGIFFCIVSSTTWAAEISLQSGELALIRMNVDTRVTCGGGNSGTPSIACSITFTEANCIGNFVNGACGKSDGSRGLCTQTDSFQNKPICKCL